ncbi:MAG: glycosyltransferase family 4 protein [Chloroflexi bacterium]|nr:glycosyltransferase family 4 protein [Chloroflexota bacterium]
MKGLRFCMLTTFYPPYNFGGDGVAAQRLSQALVRRGHHVTVLQDIDAYNLLSRGAKGPSEDPPDGVEVVRLKSGIGGMSVLFTQQSGRPLINGRKIQKIIKKGNFDVIIFHNISLLGGPKLLAVGDALKLYMAHEHWLICPSHVLWRHNREACTGRECLRCVIHYRRPPQYWRYTQFLENQLQHVDTFIAMSEFSRDKHHEFGFSKDMEVINNFLPEAPKTNLSRDNDSPHTRPYFFFAGRLERIKGLGEVIPIFKNYTNADLLIAGEGEYGSQLRKLSNGNPRVKFLGSITQNELTRHYKHAIALIAPSVGYETFGIALIEAFRQATPVIARRIGPFPEIVERCAGGVLFDGPEELFQAMQQIQGDTELRNKMAQDAFAGFLKYWSEDFVLEQFLELIRKTAALKGRMEIVTKLLSETGIDK